MDKDVIEVLASNAHQRWVDARSKDGWQFGPVHDGRLKQNPFMLYYKDLSEQEKEVDRSMVRSVLTDLEKLGYEVKEVV